VSGNPVNRIDPLGLWEISLEAYCVVGGGAKVAYRDGTLEIVGRFGIGFGGGLGIDPSGGPSPHALSQGSGYIARSSFDANIGIGIGGVSRSASYTVATGNAFVDYPASNSWTPGSYTRVSGHNMGLDGTPSKVGAGLRVGVSKGVEIGSYSNWGKTQNDCDCK
jgi:hypothetical protein